MKAKYSFKQILIIFWIILSVAYILWDLYEKAVITMYNKGYLTGQTETINAVIQKLQNEKCEPITLSDQNGNVSAIDIQCLQKPVTENNNSVNLNTEKEEEF